MVLTPFATPLLAVVRSLKSDRVYVKSVGWNFTGGTEF
jgi:hypothetical protein